MKPMTPSEVRDFVIHALMIKEIAYISGAPGIGKSDLVRQVAQEFNLLLIDERLSQKLPEDMTGVPDLNGPNGKATYRPFDTFPMEGDPVPDGYDGWLLFLDELSSASDEIWAAIYSLLLDHMLGGKKLHPKLLIVAAGNRSTDSAIARPLPDTLITRMLCCEMVPSTKDWMEWATRPTTPSNEAVVSFIKKYPDLLNSGVDPSKRDELEAYPTSRGWGKVFKAVNLHEKMTAKAAGPRKDAAGIPIDDDGSMVSAPITPTVKRLICSAVGLMAGQSFCEFYDETVQVPAPWEIAQSPSSSRIPSTGIGKVKVANDLAEYFVGTQEQSRDAILVYVNRMDKEHSALFVQTLTEKLGQTQSDQRLIEDVKKRTGYNEIDTDELKAMAQAKAKTNPMAGKSGKKGGLVSPRGGSHMPF
jgi:hypothetical protein